jgi:hypothetical protein
MLTVILVYNSKKITVTGKLYVQFFFQIISLKPAKADAL